MSADRVTLTVPSRGEYAKTVRMTASALVSRMDLTYDELDDVRIAAEEVFIYACDHGPTSGTVEMEFLIADGAFEIKARMTDGLRVTDEEAERRAAYATFLLQSVCETFELSSDESGPYLRVSMCPVGESDDAGA